MPNDAESLTDAEVSDLPTDTDDNASQDGDADATQAHAALDPEDVEDLEDSDPLPDLTPDDLVTVEDLGGEDLYEDDLYDHDGEAVLFDGDPEDFELDLGVAAYPDSVGQPGDIMVLDEPGMAARPAPRRMSRMERRRRVRLQARRVRRIIRHVEPWSVLKISLFFYACLWVIFLVAGFIVWGVAESSGTVEQIEDLVTDLFALDSFDFDAGQIMRGYALGGLALSLAGTTFNVLMCLLFNLISDLTGGLRITMIEEETARPTPPRRRRRRPPPRR